MTTTPERLTTPEESDQLDSGALVPVKDVPVATPIRRSGLGTVWDAQKKRATKGHGFWSATPLGVRSLKEYVHFKANANEAELARMGELAYGYTVALPTTSAGLALMRLLQAPFYRDKWEGTPPSLSQLYNAARTGGRFREVYGHAVVLAHAVGYALMWIGQRPGRSFLAVLTISAFIFADKL